jgi:hypothetical protein
MLYNDSTLPVYEAASASGASRKVCAQSILDVAGKYDVTADPLVSVKLSEAGVHILSDAPEVAFTASASPSGSGAVYPSGFTVGAGDSVIFTAVPVSGYTFSQWLRNGSVLSESNPAQIAVSPLASGENSAVYTALFTANA